MKTVFTSTIIKDEQSSGTGIPVPAEAVEELGSHKRPKVKVTVGDYTYRSTVAVYGGIFILPLSAEHRQGAGVQAGDTVEVTLELDTEPRTVEVPPDMMAALAAAPGAVDAFQALSYTARKEHVRQVETAKAPETRQRRIDRILAKLTGS